MAFFCPVTGMGYSKLSINTLPQDRSNYKNFETVVVEHFTGLGALETARVTPMKLALDSFWFLSFIHPPIGVMSNSVIYFSF